LRRHGSIRAVMTATALASLLSACAIEPEQLAEIRQDLQKHADSLPPEVLSRPLTVDDAIALAIANNLDSRVKTMEEVLAQGKADLSIFAMLPEMAAKANLSKRGPRKATTSKTLSDGSIAGWSTGEETVSRTGDLTATSAQGPAGRPSPSSAGSAASPCWSASLPRLLTPNRRRISRRASSTPRPSARRRSRTTAGVSPF